MGVLASFAKGYIKSSLVLVGMNGIDKFKLLVCMLSPVGLFATPWTAGPQAPLSMGFSRQEYWSGLPFPPPGDLSHPETEPESLESPMVAG